MCGVMGNCTFEVPADDEWMPFSTWESFTMLPTLGSRSPFEICNWRTDDKYTLMMPYPITLLASKAA